jgi:hypothetical protein
MDTPVIVEKNTFGEKRFFTGSAAAKHPSQDAAHVRA